MCKTGDEREPAVERRELSTLPCYDLQRWVLQEKGTYVHTQPMRTVVWQKHTQHCKAIILQ